MSEFVAKLSVTLCSAVPSGLVCAATGNADRNKTVIKAGAQVALGHGEPEEKGANHYRIRVS